MLWIAEQILTLNKAEDNMAAAPQRWPALALFFLALLHGLWDLSSTTRDQTRTLSSERVASQALDRQRVPQHLLSTESPLLSSQDYGCVHDLLLCFLHQVYLSTAV